MTLTPTVRQSKLSSFIITSYNLPLTRMQMVVESVFDEGRCIHANEGNNDRIQECTMCFNHVLMNVSFRSEFLTRYDQPISCRKRSC